MKGDITDPLLSQQEEVPEIPAVVSKKLPPEIIEIQKTLDYIQSLRACNFEDIYCKKRGQVKETFQGLNSVFYSKELNILAYQSKNKYITVLAADTNKKKFSIKAYSDDVTSICISPDGTLLSHGSEEKVIRLWSLIENRMIATLRGHTGSVKSVIFTDDNRYLISGSSDSVIKFWNLSKKKEEFYLKDHTKSVNCLKMNKLGNLLVSGSDDFKVKIWDIGAKKSIQSLDQSKSEILCIQYSPDGKWLAAGTRNSGILLWDTENSYSFTSITNETCPINSICFNEESMYVISGSGDSTLKFFDLSGEVIQEFKERSPIESICIMNKKLGIMLQDLTFKMRSLQFNQEDIFLKSYSKPIIGSNLSKNGELLTVSVDELGIEVWNIKEQKSAIEIAAIPDCNKLIPLSFDQESGRFIGYTNEKIVIKKLGSEEEAKVIAEEERVFDQVWITNDQNFLIITGSYFGLSEIRKWNLETCDNEFLIPCDNPGEGKFKLLSSLSPDERYCVISYNHSIQSYDLTSPEKEHYIYSLTDQPNDSMNLIHSPNGAILAAYYTSPSINLLDSLTGQTLKVLENPTSISSLQFTPDSRSLITSCKSEPLLIWNIEKAAIKFLIDLNFSSISQINFTNCHTYLVCSNEEGVLQLINYSKSLTPYNLEHEKSDELSPEDLLKKFRSSLEITSGINNLVLDQSSIMIESNLNNQDFSETLLSIMKEDFESILDNSWNCSFSNLKYTPLHFAAFKGETSTIEQLIRRNFRFKILADAFGKSPMFYCIFYKHRRLTDLLIEYLVDLSEINEFQLYFECFDAIKIDLPKIIENSSKNLCVLLEKAVFISQDPPQFGVVQEPIRFSDSRFVNFEDFAVSQEGSEEPLRINYTVFTLPSNIGSPSSIDLLNSFMKSTEKEIFKTTLVQSLIKSRWRALSPIIYFHTILLWTNLILLLMLFSAPHSETPNIFVVIPFTLINFILILWEGIQMIQTDKSEYFSDWWNYVDIMRTLLSFIWIVLMYFDSTTVELSWFTVFFNAVRGVSGFRAFSTTRLYIQLITNSLKSIIHFLSIFIYTTLCFGFLLYTSTERSLIKDEELGFGNLWASSFGLAFGDIDDIKSHEFSLKYVTFFCAVVLNVVLMLNMLISILGDSFDEFQLFCIFYDNNEMTQVVLEIEQIYSLIRPNDDRKHMHICENYYKTDEDVWEGKVVDIRKNIGVRVLKIEKKLEDIDMKLDKILAK